jgi:hypothetical protein
MFSGLSLCFVDDIVSHDVDGIHVRRSTALAPRGPRDVAGSLGGLWVIQDRP